MTLRHDAAPLPTAPLAPIVVAQYDLGRASEARGLARRSLHALFVSQGRVSASHAEEALAAYDVAVNIETDARIRLATLEVSQPDAHELKVEQQWTRRMTNANEALRRKQLEYGATAAFEERWTVRYQEESVSLRFWTEPPVAGADDVDGDAVEHTLTIVFMDDSAAILNVVDEF